MSPSATAEVPEGQTRSRRDARDPILLNDDDVMTGFTLAEESGSAGGYIAGTTVPNCFLEYLGTEAPTSP